jgi:drug/metabolite transporter (DMT)-like permease
MTLLWISLSLLSAFTLATSDAFTKKVLDTCNEYLVAWFRLLFSLPILVAILILLPWPNLNDKFFKAFLIALPLEIVSIILYMKALKLSPLSLTLPFLSLTPVFAIVTSYVMLGEKVSLQGIAGILFITVGGYILHLHELRDGIYEPVKAIAKEKGSVLMVIVALIYSITSSLGKIAIIHSSPLFFGATYMIFLTLFFAPVALWKGRQDIKDFITRRYYRGTVIPGILYTLMVASHMTAISLTKVAYMISLKRTSVLMGILYGYFLFRERHIKERLAGAIIMSIGFFMIVTTS